MLGDAVWVTQKTNFGEFFEEFVCDLADSVRGVTFWGGGGEGGNLLRY